jgi:hypothetical protein
VVTVVIRLAAGRFVDRMPAVAIFVVSTRMQTGVGHKGISILLLNVYRFVSFGGETAGE